MWNTKSHDAHTASIHTVGGATFCPAGNYKRALIVAVFLWIGIPQKLSAPPKHSLLLHTWLMLLSAQAVNGNRCTSGTKLHQWCLNMIFGCGLGIVLSWRANFLTDQVMRTSTPRESLQLYVNCSRSTEIVQWTIGLVHIVDSTKWVVQDWIMTFPATFSIYHTTTN